MSTATHRLAPELAVSEWFNVSKPLTLAALRGRPIFLHTFQLLCPGCVTDAIPQVKRIERLFGQTDLTVIGLHTVFEHHAAMSPTTLKAFLHEYRLTSPVGVDVAEDGDDVPLTMRRYGFRGTPSSVLIGRDGTILHQAFGVEEDLAVGFRIAMALAAQVPDELVASPDRAEQDCGSGRCVMTPITMEGARG
nr:TlpA family protein disulfide reductase [Rhizobium metallidurans]